MMEKFSINDSHLMLITDGQDSDFLHLTEKRMIERGPYRFSGELEFCSVRQPLL